MLTVAAGFALRQKHLRFDAQGPCPPYLGWRVKSPRELIVGSEQLPPCQFKLPVGRFRFRSIDLVLTFRAAGSIDRFASPSDTATALRARGVHHAAHLILRD
jgi:hypothetical protein